MKTQDEKIAEAGRIVEALREFVDDERDPEKPLNIFSKVIVAQHRTIQQRLFRLILCCMVEWAEDYDNGYFDARNDSTVRLSKIIIDALRKGINSDDDHNPFSAIGNLICFVKDRPCLPYY